MEETQYYKLIYMHTHTYNAYIHIHIYVYMYNYVQLKSSSICTLYSSYVLLVFVV